jgi:hypothetical protein
MANVQVIELNSYIISKVIKAAVILENVINKKEKTKWDDNTQKTIKVIDEKGNSVYDYKSVDGKLLDEKVLPILNELVDAFEAEYPYSIDQNMFEIYSEELQKRTKKRNKRKTSPKDAKTSNKFLNKKKKMDFFSNSELKDEFFYKLKVHLHLDMIHRHSKAQESDVVIDLGSSTSTTEDNVFSGEPDKENTNVTAEKTHLHQLIKPEME